MNSQAVLQSLKLGHGRVAAAMGTHTGVAPDSGTGRQLRLLGATALGLTAAVLCGCATAPSEPVSEKLDPDTATTITVLSQPIELFSQTSRAKQTDPFAYIAPFETNRMGSRDLFLWVSTPQAQGQLTPPQVICNGQPLSLQPLSQDAGTAAGTSVGSSAGAPGGAVLADASSPNLAPANATPAIVNPGSGGDFGAVGPGGVPVKVDLSKLSLSRAPYDAPVPWGTQWYFRLPADGLKCLADAEGISLEAKAADGNAEQFSSTGRKSLASLDAFTRR